MTDAAFVIKYISLPESVGICTYTCAPLGYIDTNKASPSPHAPCTKSSVGFGIYGVISSSVHFTNFLVPRFVAAGRDFTPVYAGMTPSSETETWSLTCSDSANRNSRMPSV